jgi:hypothetical protein
LNQGGGEGNMEEDDEMKKMERWWSKKTRCKETRIRGDK